MGTGRPTRPRLTSHRPPTGDPGGNPARSAEAAVVRLITEPGAPATGTALSHLTARVADVVLGWEDQGPPSRKASPHTACIVAVDNS